MGAKQMTGEQTRFWWGASLTADLHDLEHVIMGHLENALPVEAVLRLDPRLVAEPLLQVRADFHRELERDDE